MSDILTFFSVHCFNDHFGNEDCPNLEISYLIYCKNLPNSLEVHTTKKLNIKCEPQHVTYPPSTASSMMLSENMPSYMFLYFLTTVLGFWILKIMRKINQHLMCHVASFLTFRIYRFNMGRVWRISSVTKNTLNMRQFIWRHIVRLIFLSEIRILYWNRRPGLTVKSKSKPQSKLCHQKPRIFRWNWFHYGEIRKLKCKGWFLWFISYEINIIYEFDFLAKSNRVP